MSASTGFRPAARIADIGISPITVRTARAAALRRAGRPMIILGAGEPDFDTPDHIKEAAYRAIACGQTKYTALDGTAKLKAAIREKFRRDNCLDFAEREITCGAGAKQILYNAFAATLDAGDEVVIPAPYWTSYADIVTITGGTPVPVECGDEASFLLTPQALEAAITPDTRWLLLNSPSNPSGATYGADALRALADVIARHPHIWVMSDDMYEHILYDDVPFVTFAQVAPELGDRTLTINGVSKAYAMTGWRIGYGAGPAPLIAAMAVVQSQATSCPCSVSQAAATAALSGPQEVVRDRTKDFQHRRDLVIAGLNAIPGIDCRTPQGAFYVYPNCAGMLGRTTLDGTVITDDVAFADYLMEWDVAVVPGTDFGLSPHFRISFATSQDELETALDRIATACVALGD